MLSMKEYGYVLLLILLPVSGATWVLYALIFTVGGLVYGVAVRAARLTALELEIIGFRWRRRYKRPLDTRTRQ